MYAHLLCGNREIFVLPSVVVPRAASGRPEAAADDARISQTVRRWTLHHRSDLSLTELAAMYNPCIRGWIGYYSHFYKTQLRPTLKRIDAYVIRWARRKFKRMRHQTKGARDWFDRFRRANRHLFAHWVLWQRPSIGEPCDSRVSCTVLGAPGGENPPGDSTNPGM